MSYRHLAPFAVLFCAIASGQNTPPRLQFEVASVKPSPPPTAPQSEVLLKLRDAQQNNMPLGFLPVKGSIASLKNYTLLQLVSVAYKVRVDYITGPSWASDLRFDIEGKMPEGAKNSETNEMLQSLLADRFALQFHRETKTASGYAMVVAKDGPRFEPAVESSAPPADPEEMKRRMEKMMEEMRKPTGGPRPASSWRSATATMDQVASTLASWLHAPVVNETGLTGKYQAHLELMQPETPDEPLEYRVSQAVAKAGLKLESRKTTMDFIVVDSALKTPTEN
jgi:uncharacterized protein (TIGR03435 family)